jgi:hypothetical protein
MDGTFVAAILKENVLKCGQDVVVAADAERRKVAHRLVRRTNSAVRLIGIVNAQVKSAPCGRGQSSFALVLPGRGLHSSTFQLNLSRF